MNINIMNTPKIVFIIPYRDRDLQQQFFRRHMKYILEDLEQSTFDMYFLHQNDNRTFNRGAMKNIGFIAIKEKYPNTYKNITFVFNDIDTMPLVKNFFLYETKKGVIKHFYGFKYTLGGIVSVNGEDFETMDGFPNFWSWGYEDNELRRRAELCKITIDRSCFYPILHSNIIHLQDGSKRYVNEKEMTRYKWKTTEGIKDIDELNYSYNSDNSDTIDVNYFETAVSELPTKITEIGNKQVSRLGMKFNL